jgi:hypothetical protein
LSNVTRQYAGDDRLSRICGIFAVFAVFAFGVAFTVAFIGVSSNNQTGKAEALCLRRKIASARWYHDTLVSGFSNQYHCAIERH